MKPVWTVDLSPRENTHWEPRPVLDIWEVIKFSTALFLWGVVVLAVML